jgi:transposase-like protein
VAAFRRNRWPHCLGFRKRIKNHLDRVVRGSVEETLNALLDAEAYRLCNAQRYERSEARQDTRAGYYERICRPRPARFG